MNEKKKPTIITFASWKGGTGKTTIQTAVIYVLSLMGFKCGVLDLDSNMTMSSVFRMIDKNFTSFNLLSGIKGVFTNVMENIDIIPSKLEMNMMANLNQNELSYILSNMDLSEYDYIFIDPPGTMNALTRNALCAADKIIIPTQPSILDYMATELIFNEMRKMSIPADIRLIINACDPRVYNPEIIEKLKSEYEDFIYPEKITKMKSLENLSTDIFNYKFSGLAKQRMVALVNEVIL